MTSYPFSTDHIAGTWKPLKTSKELTATFTCPNAVLSECWMNILLTRMGQLRQVSNVLIVIFMR
jgi:hypothetical protein